MARLMLTDELWSKLGCVDNWLKSPEKTSFLPYVPRFMRGIQPRSLLKPLDTSDKPRYVGPRTNCQQTLKMSMLQHGIYDKPNLRIMVEGMFYRMRVGCPWRDLPAEFGCWNSIFQKFNRWSSRNLLNKIFKSLVQDPDLEREFIDGSIVRAHQHSTGAIGEENQAMGKS